MGRHREALGGIGRHMEGIGRHSELSVSEGVSEGVSEFMVHGAACAAKNEKKKNDK